MTDPRKHIALETPNDPGPVAGTPTRLVFFKPLGGDLLKGRGGLLLKSVLAFMLTRIDARRESSAGGFSQIPRLLEPDRGVGPKRQSFFLAPESLLVPPPLAAFGRHFYIEAIAVPQPVGLGLGLGAANGGVGERDFRRGVRALRWPAGDLGATLPIWGSMMENCPQMGRIPVGSEGTMIPEKIPHFCGISDFMGLCWTTF